MNRIAKLLVICCTVVLLAGCEEPTPEDIMEQVNATGTITDQQAESLSKATYLDLNGLTSITDQQAASLSKVYDLEISETLQPLIDKYKKQQQ